MAAEIRDIRPPEPYKGKGVSYAGEKITLKEGKKNNDITKKTASALRRAVKSPRAHPPAGVARLTVHRTPQHIYAQVTAAGGAKVIATASTVQEEVREGLKGTGNVEAAKAVGRAIAERTQGRRREQGGFRPRRFSVTTGASRRSRMPPAKRVLSSRQAHSIWRDRKRPVGR